MSAKQTEAILNFVPETLRTEAAQNMEALFQSLKLMFQLNPNAGDIMVYPAGEVLVAVVRVGGNPEGVKKAIAEAMLKT